MVESRGIRKGNIWTKVEDNGFKHGYELKSFLESRNSITLPDILEVSAEKHENTLCIGTRKLLSRKNIESNGKQLEKLELGEYTWKSYREVQNEVLKVTSAVASLGLQSKERVAIIAETRAEWLTSALGCLRYGLAVVTLYINLNDTGLVHGINETEVDTIFTSSDIMCRLVKILNRCSKVKNVIVFEDQLDGIGNGKVDQHVKVIPFQEFLTLGTEQDFSKNKPKENDTAIIMYTSGSTGNPKGVEITHKNVFYSFIAYTIQANLNSSDRYLAYLPLAHVMELVTEIALLSLGVTIAYSSPFTLTNNSPKIMKGTLGDARVAKPTAITAVPLILDRIIKTVSVNVEKQGKLKAKLFKHALRFKKDHEASLTSRALDIIIFNKVKAELGGSVKMMVVGGAPLSPQTHSMIRTMFGCTLQVGYGCTETSACISSMDSDDVRTGHVGPPNAFVQVKLRDWEEGDYRITDTPRPRGEIVVGGPCVTSGYFKLPSETSESFYVEDGVQWFRTGDIGEFDETGVLYVIDRKKDLVKLKHGEYVSLGNIESKIKTCSIIDNICVYADPCEEYTVAIILPSQSYLEKIAAENGLTDVSIDKLCVESQIKQIFLEKIQAHSKQYGLGKWDIPQKVHLTTLVWTPDNGMVTAALKLKRKDIYKEYEQEINAMYNKN